MCGLIFAAALSVFGNAVECPEADVAAFFHSRKVERGMVENPDPVCGWEAEIVWHGFHGGFEACYDMTRANGRAGRYNELSARAGYEWEPVAWFAITADYVYKHEADGHTQELEAQARFPLPWVTPYTRWNLDVDDDAGALYAVFGAYRDFVLLDVLTVTPECGFGFGNAKRNRADFDAYRDAGRDIHAGVAAEWEFLPGLFVGGYVTLYDQFTEAGRKAYRNGFFAVAGASVRAAF